MHENRNVWLTTFAKLKKCRGRDEAANTYIVEGMHGGKPLVDWWKAQIGLKNGKAAVSGWKREALESVQVDFNLDRVKKH